MQFALQNQLHPLLVPLLGTQILLLSTCSYYYYLLVPLLGTQIKKIICHLIPFSPSFTL